MERRTFLKAAVIAGATPAVAFAPSLPAFQGMGVDEFLSKATPAELVRYHSVALAEAIRENGLDPRQAVKALSHQISALMNDIDDFQFVGIQASNANPRPVHTIFEV